ncbi:MAG: hypothetical protein Q9214_007333, partial [Letrouitia sp. 1 TL-2023]
LTSSVLGVAWCFFRIRYALGYLDPNQSDGRGRLRGNWFYYPELALLFGTMVVGVNMVGLPGKVLGLLR